MTLPIRDASLLFEAGQYAGVIGLLQDHAQGGREWGLLGTSMLRVGQLAQAETPLLKASILGDEEGSVEYGNLLRLLGRFDEASAHLEGVTGGLKDMELRLRALRWWGVSDFQAGRTEAGLKLTERAWHGYVALGDDAMTARVSQSLAQMHALLGHFARAKLLLQEAIRALPVEPDNAARLSALKNLLDLQIADGDFKDAQETLADVRRTAKYGGSRRVLLHLQCSTAELHRLKGEYAEYALQLGDIQQQVESMDDHGLRVWVTSRQAEHHSLMGQHGEALRTLLSYGLPESEWPAELWATDGLIRRRRGEHERAYTSLDLAADLYRSAGAEPELLRVLLHQAACALRLGQETATVTLLQEALTLLLRLQQFAVFKPDLEELHELLAFAVLDPDTAPYVDPLLDQLSQLSGSPRLLEDGAMRIQLTTLGKVEAHRDGQALSFSYLHTPLLLAYLALHPNRTRAEIQADLFPERDAKVATGYVRQCIWDLRDKLGSAVVCFEGPHHAPRYRLGHAVRVELDLEALFGATRKGEVTRALALYRGPFMPGLEESDWLLTRREEALLAISFELRNQMARYRDAGDNRRLVMIANQLLKLDPLNFEVMQERVNAAQTFAPPTELARYVAQLNRFLN